MLRSGAGAKPRMWHMPSSGGDSFHPNKFVYVASAVCMLCSVHCMLPIYVTKYFKNLYEKYQQKFVGVKMELI